MKLQFLGANRQVTGSCYFLEHNGVRLLVDCGMFQEREYLERNWSSFPVAPDSIQYLLLTHAHLDHCGLIPKLVSEGFAGKIITTAASRDLAEIILSDAAHIQEEDAKQKRRRHEREGRKTAHPDVPLYTIADVRDALPMFESAAYSKQLPLNKHVSVAFHDAGHILGSAGLELTLHDGGGQRTIVFSGDVGQWGKPLLRDPALLQRADYVVMESTYGDRDHEDMGSVDEQLARIINETVDAGGNVLIPTFAVERAQELLYHLARLLYDDRIPHLLAFLDSPMAVNATEVFRRHRECMDDEAWQVIDSGERLLMFPGLKLVRTVSESKAINRIKGSCIIMAGSGMCTAGRIKHHLVRNITRAESTILFVGYQAHGTLGRHIVDGDRTVRILGSEFPVKARIAQIHGFSAHADQSGLLRWLGAFAPAPRRVFLTHGEQEAANALAARIKADRSLSVEIPEYKQTTALD